jgi:hypothetical protein
MKIASRLTTLAALAALGIFIAQELSPGAASATSLEVVVAEHPHRPVATASWEQIFASLNR